MNHHRPMLVVVTILVTAGCASRPSGPPGGDLAGGEWVDPRAPRPETAADRAGGLEGLPPLWFYENGPDGYVAAPVLAAYHSEKFHMLLLGVASLGWTSEGPVSESGEEGFRTTDWDFNLAGVYNSNFERTRTPTRVVDRRAFRFLWFVPIYSSEEVRSASGAVRRSWLFGLIPLH